MATRTRSLGKQGPQALGAHPRAAQALHLAGLSPGAAVRAGSHAHTGPGADGSSCCRGGTHSWAAGQAARETGCFPGSKTLIFPFWGHLITRLPLLFLLPFSSGRFFPPSFPRGHISSSSGQTRFLSPLRPRSLDRQPDPAAHASLILRSPSQMDADKPFASLRSQRPHLNKGDKRDPSVGEALNKMLAVTMLLIKQALCTSSCMPGLF